MVAGYPVAAVGLLNAKKKAPSRTEGDGAWFGAQRLPGRWERRTARKKRERAISMPDR
jgi:hypothetical protein